MDNKCDCPCHGDISANKSYGKGIYCWKCRENHEEMKKREWKFSPMHGFRSNVYDRLEGDPHFRALVDQLEYFLSEGWSTPSELREALIVAATRIEYRTIRPLLVDPSEWCLEESVLKALGKKESS